MSEADAEAPVKEPKLVYEIEIDLPDLPKGELVQIVGLGEFENKGTYDVNEDEAERWRALDRKDRTLLQASKNMYGVSVTTYASKNQGGGS